MKLLIVDDESEIRNVLRLLLENKAYEVLEASSGAQAIELVRNTSDIDMIIMDVMMPGISGIEATRTLRNFTDAPVLFLTANSLEQSKIDAYAAGGDDYLVKPFSARELLLKVEALTRRYNVYRTKQTPTDEEAITLGHGVLLLPARREVFTCATRSWTCSSISPATEVSPSARTSCTRPSGVSVRCPPRATRSPCTSSTFAARWRTVPPLPRSSARCGERGTRSMSNKPKDGRFRLFGPQYSLRNSLFALILLGILFASLTFVVVRFAGIFVVDRYYVTEENRTKREVRYVTELQSFITDEQLSSADISRVSEWLSLNRFVYVAVYRDDELVFSPDEWGSSQGVPGSPDTGITVKYPSEEELLRYAENGALYPLVFSDQTVACSVAEFTEYLYYDAINLISLVLAMVTLAAIMIVYFHKITVRISRLADDVSVVSGGDMSHVIRADAREDEISDLSRHVEAMRSSIVHTLESERQAVDANTELITAMSHDIRTPLTVLLGYIDVLKLHSESELCASYVKAAEATALRLKELSDDMFRYFVVFGNRLEVTIQSYDAATLLEQLLAEHILLLTEQGYVFEADETSAFPEQASLTTDAPNLMRIIDNIFSNIKKYADPSTPIYIALCAENDNCCLQIRNKVRQDGVPSESTGIGLKTCDRIASAIGSTFEAKREGDVFTVRITLPMSAQEAPKEGKNA